MAGKTSIISANAKATTGRPKGWKMTTLGEVGVTITGKTPSKDNPEDWGDSLDFITPSDIISDSKHIANVARKLSKEGAKRFQKMIIPSGSVVVTCIGSDMGKAVINKNDALANQQINSIKVNSENNIDYIYYLLKNSYAILRNIAVGGSTMPILNKSTFESLEYLIPELHEQCAIAAVLSSLDDKIELLREQNKTLEATAQAIFKEWFVNYRFSGVGKMIDSELGKIPEGWRVGRLSEIANFINGLALQKYPPESSTEYLPVIKIKELGSGISEQTDKASSRLDKKYIVEDGDVLFSWSGSLIVDIWKYGKGALNQHLFRVTSDKFPKWFYFHWIKEHLPSFQQTATAKAVTMGHIQRHHLDDAPVAVPDDKFLKVADVIFAPLFEKFINNNSQIQTLSALRDALLPKLMSGTIRTKV